MVVIMTEKKEIEQTSDSSLESENLVSSQTESIDASETSVKQADQSTNFPKEIGGRDGLEPTRYGDWEYKGRCIDL